MLGHTICFVRDGDRLLLLNRLAPPAMGLWTGVGGKIEPGETPRAGVLREVWEEAALRPERLRLAGVVTWGSGGMYAYVAERPAGDLTPTPRVTAEGLLAWHPTAWVLHPDNGGIARHVKRVLPGLLAGGPCVEHRFRFAPGATSTDWIIEDYSTVALADLAAGG